MKSKSYLKKSKKKCSKLTLSKMKDNNSSNKDKSWKSKSKNKNDKCLTKSKNSNLVKLIPINYLKASRWKTIPEYKLLLWKKLKKSRFNLLLSINPSKSLSKRLIQRSTSINQSRAMKRKRLFLKNHKQNWKKN